LAGQTAYGQKLDDVRRQLHESNAHLKAVENELKHLRGEQAKNAHRTGQAVGHEINGTSANATRRVKRR
jgi:predicted phage-related endonuclease